MRSLHVSGWVDPTNEDFKTICELVRELELMLQTNLGDKIRRVCMYEWQFQQNVGEEELSLLFFVRPVRLVARSITFKFARGGCELRDDLGEVQTRQQAVQLCIEQLLCGSLIK